MSQPSARTLRPTGGSSTSCWTAGCGCRRVPTRRGSCRPRIPTASCRCCRRPCLPLREPRRADASRSAARGFSGELRSARRSSPPPEAHGGLENPVPQVRSPDLRHGISPGVLGPSRQEHAHAAQKRSRKSSSTRAENSRLDTGTRSSTPWKSDQKSSPSGSSTGLKPKHSMPSRCRWVASVPVSYTHLDVYKRQLRPVPRGGRLHPDGRPTHLSLIHI